MKLLQKTFVSLLAFLLTTTTAFGMCTWGMVPQGRAFQPVDATEAFIYYNDGVQTVVLQPEFRGNAEDFAIVYPTPSRPSVEEAPIDIFNELNNATNPWLPQIQFSQLESASLDSTGAQKGVVVVEEKTVGNFDVAILTATDSDDLVEWLEENEYNHNNKDSDKMDYYVDQGGFFFIALKVNMEGWRNLWSVIDTQPLSDTEDIVSKASQPLWFGELSPLEFTFKTDKPQLPMRTLKSDMPTMTFDLYTVGDNPWYVAGVDTVYADLIDKDFIAQVPSLARYNTSGKWIVRQEIKFEPKNSNRDVYLLEGDNNFPLVEAGDQKRISPSQLDKNTGILPGTRGSVTTESSINRTFNRSMTIGSRGEDVRRLQQLLNEYGFRVSETGPGSPGNETIYFGGKTKSALIRFQNFYRDDILTPVGLKTGTGYFGPSTIKFFKK